MSDAANAGILVGYVILCHAVWFALNWLNIKAQQSAIGGNDGQDYNSHS